MVVTPPLEFHNVPDSLKPVMQDLPHGVPWFPPDVNVSVEMDAHFHDYQRDAEAITKMDISSGDKLVALITLPQAENVTTDEGAGRALDCYFNEYVGHALLCAQTDAKLLSELLVEVDHKRLYHPTKRAKGRGIAWSKRTCIAFR